jgi:hypothetical protein
MPDEWSVSKLDLAAYLSRIGYASPGQAVTKRARGAAPRPPGRDPAARSRTRWPN